MYVQLFGEVYDLGAICKNAAIVIGVLAMHVVPLLLIGVAIWLLW